MIFKDKNEIRRYIWNKLVEMNLAKFPPPYGRIPNFIGVEEASKRVINHELFKKAEVVKVSPDSPQRLIREYVLRKGKYLIMPTPRLKKGFLLLKPSKIYHNYVAASTIRGAFKYGLIVDPDEIPDIDLIVTGSVAVTLNGRRLGKGGGYSELEYAILREYGKVGEETPIFTNVHDIQIVDWIPSDPFDVSIDFIATPTRFIKVLNREERPRGILWSYINHELLKKIPILSKLRKN